jgi:Nitrite/Sulfite reductase ferredoxin-like half domain
VIPRKRGGGSSPAELRKIADIVEKYKVRMVTVTGSQRIDLPGVNKSDLSAIWTDLGMPSGQAYTKGFLRRRGPGRDRKDSQGHRLRVRQAEKDLAAPPAEIQGAFQGRVAGTGTPRTNQNLTSLQKDAGETVSLIGDLNGDTITAPKAMMKKKK